MTNNPTVSFNVIARRHDEANRRFDEVNPGMKLTQESKLTILKKLQLWIASFLAMTTDFMVSISVIARRHDEAIQICSYNE